MTRRGNNEGSIPRRKDGRFSGYLSVEVGQRKYFYGKTQKEVQEKLRRAQRELEQGIIARGPKQTVQQFLEYWLEEIHKPTIRLTTYVLYRRLLDNHIIPILGHIQLQKLTHEQVQN